jgi:hypothetical protein
VLGEEVCGVGVWEAPDGLLWVCAAEPDGDALPGVVLWAATQIPDSSRKTISVDLDLITDSRLRFSTHLTESRRNPVLDESGRLLTSVATLPYSDFARRLGIIYQENGAALIF